MSTLKKDHILGAGGGAVAGGAAGAAIGAVLGDRAAESADGRQDLGHFQQLYHTMPYFVDGMEWQDYAPAYRYGLETYRIHGGRPFAEVEAELESGWGRARDTSRLTWAQARSATAHAWRELDETLHARGT